MGVDNLLNLVRDATTQTHLQDIEDLRNSSIAVDISHWIYKACYACPEALYYRTNVNQIYSTVTNYINNYVELLKFYNVKLTFVFDGLKLPAKKITHEERASRKAENRKMVEKMLKMNNKSEARRYMLRCIEIKFDIVQQVIKYCKKQNIKYIVAPYEADAQIAFLANEKVVDFTITEDTDLILYGCEKIIYKLDTTGSCLLYKKEKLNKCLGKQIGCAGDSDEMFDFNKFRRICILSGCDYLKNIPSVGLQSAKKFFALTKQDNLRILLPKLSTYLKSPRLVGKVTEDYINGFINAESTFKHHIIYDPSEKKLRPLEPYPDGKSAIDFPWAGRSFCNTQACDLIKGNINLDSLDPELDLDTEENQNGNNNNNNNNMKKSNKRELLDGVTNELKKRKADILA